MGALDQAKEKNYQTKRNKPGGDQSSGSPVTRNGFETAEVISALQKSIRRGEEIYALYWAAELIDSNEGYRMWRRLLVIAAEDIGLGDPDMVARIMLMKQAHDMGRELNIPFLAIMLMCRAPKNREADDAAEYFRIRRSQGWKLPMMPEAVDGHTRRGRTRLYQIARETGEDFEKTWGREFHYGAGLLKSYQPDTTTGTEDPYRHLLMELFGLPYKTYDLDGMPENERWWFPGEKGGKKIDPRAVMKLPQVVNIQRGDPETGETIPDTWWIESFTTPGQFYKVTLDECECPAWQNSGGAICKHQLALIRWRRDTDPR